MIRTILTHPGGAHKDDLLAVAVLIAEHGAPVVRRNPTEDDLNNPETAVVDIGGSHDPSRHNYDHHHFPREHAPTCALSLVLDGMGLYENARRLCDWLEPAEWFDSRGPKKTAEHLGIPRKAVGQLHSPIDVTVLRRFAKRSELGAGDTLYEVLRFVGDDLLTYLRDAQSRIARLESVVQRWSLSHGDATIEALFLPRTDPPEDEPSSAVHQVIRSKDLQRTIAAIVYPDRRGDGYGIGRYEDHARLDFSRVGTEPDVHFAHVSGFMCKTSARQPERLRELVTNAWLPLNG